VNSSEKVEIPFIDPAFGCKDLCSLLFGGENRLQRSWDAFASVMGLDHQILFTSSCRAALLLAYKSLGLRGEVIVSPLACTAALLPILSAGLRPRFADICPYTFNLCPESAKLHVGADTIAIQTIYLGGNAAGAAANSEIALANGLKLIENCAHSVGAHDKGQPVGTFGDVACFSFPKIVNGTGGGLCARSDTLRSRARDLQIAWKRTPWLRIGFRLLYAILGPSRSRLFKDFNEKSLVRFARRHVDKIDGSYGEVRLDKCSNPRATELAWAAQQLGKWNQLIAKRQAAALLLKQVLLQQVPEVQLQNSLGGTENAYARFYIRVPAPSDRMIASLRQHGIEAIHISYGSGSCQERLDRDFRFGKYVDLNELPNYVRLHDNIIALPLHSRIGLDEVLRIGVALKKSLMAFGTKRLTFDDAVACRFACDHQSRSSPVKCMQKKEFIASRGD
jgi:dTDP-4-amino-4,6-dideoxygalactose transaminase